MKNQIIIFLLLFLVVHLTAQESRTNSYSDFIFEINKLEQDEQYSEAKKRVVSNMEIYAEQRFEMIKELEYLNNKLECYEENLTLWKEAHSEGYFFLLNARMPKYEPYLQFPLFDSLVTKDAELREEALAKSNTIYEINEPDNYQSHHEYPLIFIFHGGGRNLEKAKDSWRLPREILSDYLVVYLQSYLHYDSGTFGWRSGDTKAHNDVKRILSEIMQNYRVDTSRIFLFGISAGGTMAFDVALAKTIPVTGLLTFCPGMPRDLKESDLNGCDVRIYMLGGEGDFYLDKQNELAKMFTEADIKYKQVIVAGMGHDFPSDLEARLIEGLSFISEKHE